MTTERAIEILNPEHREHYDSIETVNEACRMGMKALQRTRWIPVEERLPENNHKKGRAGDVLCYVPPRDGCFQNGVYLGKLEHIAADGEKKYDRCIPLDFNVDGYVLDLI